MKKIIFTQAPKTITDGLVTQTNTAITSFKPYGVNLTEEEKLGGRRMAEGREGYARLVSAVATQNAAYISRSDNPADLSSLLTYYGNLAANIQAVYSLLEVLEETQLGTAADIMVLVDRYVKNLQIERDNSASLDLSMREVDEWNKRFANTGENAAKKAAENADNKAA